MKLLEILAAFLRLGLMSFGGPVAHLGYFRAEFVARRKWLSEDAYADIVALAQFVPGPASSQTGFALGILRGGLAGGLAAWVGFTLPSALLMLLAAYGLPYAQSPAAQGAIRGLKLLAVAVVAQAVWSMGRTLCPDRLRAGFALTIAALLIAAPGSPLQLAAIAAGALFGLLALHGMERPHTTPLGVSTGHKAAGAAIAAYFLFLASLPLAAALSHNGTAALAEAFYRAGALVFGGGHVVLPLLQEAVVQPGWVSAGDFLAGYGAAQALPGPLFAIAAFLGAKASAAQAARRAPPSPPSQSSCPACYWSTVHSPSGTACGRKPAPAPRSMASTLPSLASSPPPSTSPYGPRPCFAPSTPHSRSWPSPPSPRQGSPSGLWPCLPRRRAQRSCNSTGSVQVGAINCFIRCNRDLPGIRGRDMRRARSATPPLSGAKIPRVQERGAGCLEIHEVAGDNGHAVHERGGGQQPIPDRPRIGHLKSRRAPGDGCIHGQDAPAESWQDMLIEPRAQDCPLNRIAALNRQDAGLQFQQNDG